MGWILCVRVGGGVDIVCKGWGGVDIVCKGWGWGGYSV